MELLLVSNGCNKGSAYLSHAIEPLAALLSDKKRVLFVPFALADHESYLANVKEALAPLNLQITGAHEDADAAAHLERYDAVFVGGGNTFRLLRDLYDTDLLGALQRSVCAGELLYAGWSAGSNVACPTICTTNDMPITEPQSLCALGLVPFQINPHYLDPDPTSTHGGETRDERLLQYLEEPDSHTVIGLREGTWLRVSGDPLHPEKGGALTCVLGGAAVDSTKGPAKLFAKSAFGSCEVAVSEVAGDVTSVLLG